MEDNNPADWEPDDMDVPSGPGLLPLIIRIVVAYAATIIALWVRNPYVSVAMCTIIGWVSYRFIKLCS